MSAETAIRIASRLYEIRETCRRLHGDGWPAQVAQWRPFIERAMARWNCPILEAGQRMVLRLQERCPGSEYDQMLLLGAIVEMAEEAPADA